MADKNSPIKHPDQSIDPISVDLVVNILSISLNIVSIVQNLGWLPGKEHKVKEKYRKLREKTLRLYNLINDFVLVLGQHQKYETTREEDSVITKRLTIEQTLIDLKERDYLNWREIKKSLNALSQECYNLLEEVHELNLIYTSREEKSVFSRDIYGSIDDLLIGFGKMELGIFIHEMRNAVDRLAEFLYNMGRP